MLVSCVVYVSRIGFIICLTLKFDFGGIATACSTTKGARIFGSKGLSSVYLFTLCFFIFGLIYSTVLITESSTFGISGLIEACFDSC